MVLALWLAGCAHAPVPRTAPPAVSLTVCPERPPSGVDRDDASAVVTLEAGGTQSFRLRVGVVANACQAQPAALPEVVRLDCRDPHGAHDTVRVTLSAPGLVEIELAEIDDERATPPRMVVKERRAVDPAASFSVRAGHDCEP